MVDIQMTRSLSLSLSPFFSLASITVTGESEKEAKNDAILEIEGDRMRRAKQMCHKQRNQTALY